MALSFANGTTDHIEVTQNATINTLALLTLIVWYKPSALSANFIIARKAPSSLTGWSLGINNTSGDLRWDVKRATTASTLKTSNTPLLIDRWAGIVVTSNNQSGGNTVTDHHIYTCDLTLAVQEATYGTNTAGSGAQSSDAANNMAWGNVSGGSTLAAGGAYANGLLFNRILSLEEIIRTLSELRDFGGARQQRAGCVVASEFGTNGTQLQWDWSGNKNNGTVTGALVTRGLPLRAPSARSIYGIAAGGSTFTQALGGTLTPAGVITKAVLLGKSGLLTPAGTAAKLIALLKGGATTPSGAVVKQAQAAKGGTVSSSGTITKAVSKSLAGTLTPSGLLIKLVQKFFAGTLTSSGTISKVKVALLTLGGTLTSSGTIVRTTQKSLAGLVTPAGTIAKFITRTLTGTLTSSGVARKTAQLAKSGALTISGAIRKLIAKLLGGTLTSRGTLTNNSTVTQIRLAAGTATLIDLTPTAAAFALTPTARTILLAPTAKGILTSPTATPYV